MYIFYSFLSFALSKQFTRFSFQIVSNSNVIAREGTRIAEKFRGQRLMVRLEKFIYDNLKQKYPNANYQVWSSGDDREGDRWLRYKTADALDLYRIMVIHTTHERIKQSLSYTKNKHGSVKRLVDTTEINNEVIAKLFDRQFFMCGSKNMIHKVNLTTIVNGCKQCTTFYSKDDNNVITGISFMDLQRGEHQGLAASVFNINCINLDVVMEHLYALLHHVVKVSDSDSKIHIRISLQSDEDMDGVFELLETVGNWIPSYRAREGTILYGNIPKHRL